MVLCGLQRYVDWWVDTRVSEEQIASIFRSEDEGSMFFQNIVPTYIVSTQIITVQ
jgi:hypothetical protein